MEFVSGLLKKHMKVFAQGMHIEQTVPRMGSILILGMIRRKLTVSYPDA